MLLGYGFFFFQAEDGIRDLVRSRGLGDVYKRQGNTSSRMPMRRAAITFSRIPPTGSTCPVSVSSPAVSYTHLTLPTSDLV